MGGDSREDDIELYRRTAVAQASNGLVVRVGFIPYVDPFLASIVKALLGEFGLYIVEAINDLLGTEDDYIGSVPLLVSGKDLVTLARPELKDFRGILWHLESPLISGEGGDY